jgi:hypothetical protein
MSLRFASKKSTGLVAVVMGDDFLKWVVAELPFCAGQQRPPFHFTHEA